MSLRLGEEYILELNSPHRIARNFGFSQEVSRVTYDGIQIYLEKHYVAGAWKELFSNRSGLSYLYLEEMDRFYVTERYLKWYHSNMEGYYLKTDWQILIGDSASESNFIPRSIRARPPSQLLATLPQFL